MFDRLSSWVRRAVSSITFNAKNAPRRIEMEHMDPGKMAGAFHGNHQQSQRQCAVCGCQMIKLGEARGCLDLTLEELMAGVGGAEECWECGRVYCDVCYPKKPPNTCICGRGRYRVRNIDGITYTGSLRLVKVRYSSSISPLGTEELPVAVFIRSVLQELARLTSPTDMPRRVQLCEEGLRRVSREVNPIVWAEFQFELGSSLQLNPLGDRSKNLERALQAHKAALTVWTREEVYPEFWAAAQGSVGQVYQDRIQGNRAENVERAIRAHQSALTVFTREMSPLPWAMAQNDLGNAYQKRIRGDRAENLERAIEAYQASLIVLSREASPMDWARTQHNLGNAYRDRIRGDRADNLERAIETFQAALSVFTLETHPDLWAHTQNNLGIAYLSRIRGDRAESLEQAIKAFQSALTVFNHDTFPEQWGMANHNLGNAYQRRIRGDRAENLERAIEAFTEALLIHTPEAFPADWAMTQCDLGSGYRERIFGNREENLERAIEAYTNALIVYTRDDFPLDWAKTQTNLGTAYKLMKRNRAENVERAIEAYKAALTIYTCDTLPEQWAGVHMTLGGAYLNRMRGNYAENCERAIEALQAALTIYTPEAYPEDWAKMQHNLGIAYENRVYGEREKNLIRAIQAYQATLEVHSPDSFPQDAFTTACTVVRLQFKRQNWSEAYSALLIALDAAERLYTSSLTAESKTYERLEHAHLYQQIVDVCFRLDPPRPLEAFFYAEEGHTRFLRDRLGLLRFPTPRNIPLELVESEDQLLRDTRSLESWIRDAPDKATRRYWVSEAEAIRAELDALWDTFSRDYGASNYVALRRGGKLEWEDIQHWLSAQGRRVVLVEFSTLADRLIAFIVREDKSEPCIVSLEISPRRLWEFVRRFYREVRYRFNIRYPLEETWRGLEPILLPKLMPYLKDAELVYFIPHTILHELPLHALEFEGKPLIEYFPIAYAPSAAIAMRVAGPTSNRSFSITDGEERHERVLVVGDPMDDLPFLKEVAARVATRFGTQPFQGREATKKRVQPALERVTEAHFMTHAQYAPNAPLESGIHLANDTTLTARDVLTRPLDLRLLALWGCETGAQDIQPGDEREGMAPAFLCAGVSSLILSMWEVSGVATTTLMEHFYDRLYDNHGVKISATVDALQAAMLETKEEFPHTHYWAPFFLYGSWK